MGNPIQLSDTIHTAGDSVWCDLSDQAVLLNVASGVYFGLDSIGCAIWKYLQEPHTVNELVEHLLSSYDVSREVCEDHTVRFLGGLEERNLIVVDRHVAVA
jgi:hypothetical protein